MFPRPIVLACGVTSLLAAGLGPPGPGRAGAAEPASFANPAVHPATRSALPNCEEAYTNVWTPPTYYFPAGAGAEVLDDLHLGPLHITELCSFEIGYFEPGPDGASATVRILANDPQDGPPATELATFTVPGLLSGANLLHVEVPASSLTQDVWVGVSFSSPEAGLLLANPAWPGASDDLFFQMPAGQHGTFGGNPVANFMMGLKARGGSTDVGPGSAGVSGITAEPSPNPMLRGLSLRFMVPVRAAVRAQVLDVSGRAIAELADATYPAGEHTLTWNGLTSRGRRAAPGVYMLKLALPGYAGIRKFVVLQ